MFKVGQYVHAAFYWFRMSSNQVESMLFGCNSNVALLLWEVKTQLFRNNLSLDHMISILGIFLHLELWHLELSYCPPPIDMPCGTYL